MQTKGANERFKVTWGSFQRNSAGRKLLRSPSPNSRRRSKISRQLRMKSEKWWRFISVSNDGYAISFMDVMWDKWVEWRRMVVRKQKRKEYNHWVNQSDSNESYSLFLRWSSALQTMCSLTCLSWPAWCSCFSHTDMVKFLVRLCDMTSGGTVTPVDPSNTKTYSAYWRCQKKTKRDMSEYDEHGVFNHITKWRTILNPEDTVCVPWNQGKIKNPSKLLWIAFIMVGSGWIWGIVDQALSCYGIK